MITSILHTCQNERIVFLNPMGVASIYWTQTLKIGESFKEYELVFLDYPGYLKTPFAKYETLNDLALEIFKELQQLTEKPTCLIGFSYGGNIAISLSRYFKAHKLIIIGANAFINSEEIGFYESLEDSITKKGLSDFAETLISYCYNEKEKKENPFLKFILYTSLKMNAKKDALLQQIAHLKNNTQIDSLRSINVKTLIIKGLDDETIFKGFHKRHETIFSTCKFIDFPDTGHFVFENNICAVKTIKNFINKIKL